MIVDLKKAHARLLELAKYKWLLAEHFEITGNLLFFRAKEGYNVMRGDILVYTDKHAMTQSITMPSKYIDCTDEEFDKYCEEIFEKSINFIQNTTKGSVDLCIDVVKKSEEAVEDAKKNLEDSKKRLQRSKKQLQKWSQNKQEILSRLRNKENLTQ
jgi:hypothetical protein